MDRADEGFFRLSHEGREVGWGEPAGAGFARISNVTGHPDFSQGDVVEYVHEEPGVRRIVRKIGALRAGFAKRSK